MPLATWTPGSARPWPLSEAQDGRRSAVSEQGQEVVLVRHGETEWSATGRHTSRTDVPLTDAGRRQAESLRACLAGWSFALVLTSPLRRAAETCRLAGLGAVTQVRPDLMEWDYGDYEGRTTADIRSERPGWTLWSDGVPGGETSEEVGARADRVIAEVREAHGDVALFSHGHILRVLAARWVGLPPEAGRSFALATSTISVLGHERETPVIVRWNHPCGA
jgi:broad specificity phosphatase PhoE